MKKHFAAIALAGALMPAVGFCSDAYYYFDNPALATTHVIKRIDTSTGAIEVVSAFSAYTPSNLAFALTYWEGGTAYLFTQDGSTITVYSGTSGSQPTVLFSQDIGAGGANEIAPLVQLSTNEFLMGATLINVSTNTMVNRGTSGLAWFYERGTRNIVAVGTDKSTVYRTNLDTGVTTTAWHIPLPSSNGGGQYAQYYSIQPVGGPTLYTVKLSSATPGFGYYLGGEFNGGVDPATALTFDNYPGTAGYVASGEWLLFPRFGTEITSQAPTLERYSATGGVAVGTLAPHNATGRMTQLSDSILLFGNPVTSTNPDGSIKDEIPVSTIHSNYSETTSTLVLNSPADGSVRRGAGPDFLSSSNLQISSDGTKLFNVQGGATGGFMVIDIATGDRSILSTAFKSSSTAAAVGAKIDLLVGASIRAYSDYLTGKEKLVHGSEAALDINHDLTLDASDLQQRQGELNKK